MLPRFSSIADEANHRLASDYERLMGIDRDLLLRRTRPHALLTFLRTPIPLSCAGAIAFGAALVWEHVPLALALLALPLGYIAVTILGYGVLCGAGERGMAMGAQAVTYRERPWKTADEAAAGIAPSLFHGWTHLAGRRGLIHLHNSLAIATAYLRAREQGGTYRVFHFPELEQTVEAGYKLGGWSDLERDVRGETRGPIGWLREWTKYQYLGHSRKAYVLGGLLAGRALRLAAEEGIDPWLYLRSVGNGQSMAAAEQHLRTRV